MKHIRGAKDGTFQVLKSKIQLQTITLQVCFNFEPEQSKNLLEKSTVPLQKTSPIVQFFTESYESRAKYRNDLRKKRSFLLSGIHQDELSQDFRNNLTL